MASDLDPKRSAYLLKRLEHAGFTDDEFQLIHHLTKPKPTIHEHIRYCTERVDDFQSNDSTNALVQKRLEIVFKAFEAGEFRKPARPGVFEALAAAAECEIPIR